MCVVGMGMTVTRTLVSDLEEKAKPLPSHLCRSEALREMAKSSLLVQVKMLTVFLENAHHMLSS